ncbi:MAG: sulfurtransferase complex subunit TusB [Halioglobus sp.]
MTAMILHMLNASPSSTAFRDCVKVMQAGDAIVLMGGGIYAMLEGTEAFAALTGRGVKINVLAADAKAAGVVVPPGVEDIDMDGLVLLTEQFSRQLAWY